MPPNDNDEVTRGSVQVIVGGATDVPEPAPLPLRLSVLLVIKRKLQA